MQQEFCTKCRSPNVGQFNLCWHSGKPPHRGSPVRRGLRAPPVQIDPAKLRARCVEMLAVIAEQPGQQRKCKTACVCLVLFPRPTR